MSDRLQEIRARLDMATTGPWRMSSQVGVWVMVHGPHNVEVAHALTYMSHDNGPLISNAPSDLAWCCGEIESLRSKIAELHDKAEER